MNTSKVPSREDVEAHIRLHGCRRCDAMLRALLAEVERLTKQLGASCSDMRSENGESSTGQCPIAAELTATLTAREAELARVRKDLERCRHQLNMYLDGDEGV